jgi:hypothetical protein
MRGVARWHRVGAAVLLTPGPDAPWNTVGWSWSIKRDGDEPRDVRVEVVGRPFRVTELPAESRNAIRSRGATAVDSYLATDDPPERIVVSKLGVGLP